MTLAIFLVLVAAFGAGFIDALAGGGGLIQLPALFATFPQAPHTTLLGTGKLAGFAGTSTLAIACSCPSPHSPPLGGGLSFIVYTLLNKDLGREHRPRVLSQNGRWLAAGTAGIIGLYDGFFGPGTGSFLVFLFVRLFGLDFLHASASAKIVNAATNAAAIILFGLTGELYWLLGLAMSVSNIAGAQFGSHLAIRRGSALVRKVFIVVVFALITKTAWDAIRLHL